MEYDVGPGVVLLLFLCFCTGSAYSLNKAQSYFPNVFKLYFSIIQIREVNGLNMALPTLPTLHGQSAHFTNSGDWLATYLPWRA